MAPLENIPSHPTGSLVSQQHLSSLHFDICSALFYNDSGLSFLVRTSIPNERCSAAPRYTGGACPCRSHSKLHSYVCTRRMAAWLAQASSWENGTSSPVHMSWPEPSVLPTTP